MKVVGIYHYDLNLDPKIQHAVSEPYGLEKILAVASEAEHEVELVMPLKKQKGEFIKLTEEEVVGEVMSFNPDLVCFSLYTCQYPAGVRIAQELKRRNSKIINVAGNRYPSFLKDNLEEPFDFCVVNEGELVFRELLQEITSLDAPNFDKIKGLVYRKNGRARFNGNHSRIQNLDELPPALRFPSILTQVYKGISLPPLSEKPPYAIMESSRGCMGACSFCDNKEVWNKTVTFRSPDKVVDEMFELKDKGVKIIYFMDLNFTSSTQQAKSLCQEMIRRDLDLSWYCMSNIETVENNPELLFLMKQAGCYKIAWGIESTNNASLKKMNKQARGQMLRLEKAIHVLDDSLNAGILNQGYYIIGFPWETADSIVDDGRRINYLPLHQLNIGIFTPIPMSRFIEGVELEEDLEKHNRNNLVYRHDSLDQETLKKLQAELHSQFYSSRAYMGYVQKSCQVDPRFKQAFNDYFKFLGKEIMV